MGQDQVSGGVSVKIEKDWTYVFLSNKTDHVLLQQAQNACFQIDSNMLQKI